MPVYGASIFHQLQASNGANTLNLSYSVLKSRSEEAAARKLIDGTHYQGKTAKKCEFVGCYSHTDQQATLIGVAALGPMVYCRPCGRAQLAKSLQIDGWRNLNRSELVRELGMICGLRFAIAEGYRSIGVGKELALAVRHLAHSDLKKHYDRIEVMRRVEPRRAAGLIHGDTDDWLTAAGYKATYLTSNKGHHLMYYWSDTLLNT